jgi:large subunit ribosomal protein L9
MKVLLTQDVYNLGHAGEVKTVADGYGRNYLLPRSMAVLATAGSLKRADSVRTAAVRRRAVEQSDIDAIAQVINGVTLHFNARTGEKGKLYGSITSTQVAEKLSELLGKEFDKRKVALREPIRDIGTHPIVIRLSTDVTPTVNVVVTPEGVAAPTAAAPAGEAAAAPAEAAAPAPEAPAPAPAAEAPAAEAPTAQASA